MIFSPPCEHAIRALIYLAGVNSDKPLQVSIIAREANVPSPFLSKIFLQLKNNGLLKSTKGPGGGYALAKSPAEITLKDVAAILDKPLESKDDCILGLSVCMDEHPCPMHNEWQTFKADIELKLKSLTIDELHQKIKEKRAFLKPCVQEL